MTHPSESGSAPTQPAANRKRIFISYKRESSPDQSVALEVFQALVDQHEVFIDQPLTSGERWAARLESELRESDFLIIFLSNAAVHSEMVRAEIEAADRLAKDHSGRPVILPLRLAYREPFDYPLSAYLNHLNWAFWEDSEDTPGLIKELIQAISGGKLTIDGKQSKNELLRVSEPPSLPQPRPSAQPAIPGMSEDAMNSESAYYVTRAADKIAFAAIKQRGVTITIKGARQTGKSSLLNKTIGAAIDAGKRVAFLDFQLFDRKSLRDADHFFLEFCIRITDGLEIEDKVNEYSSQLSQTQWCTRYMSRYVLGEVGSPLVLAMDEIDQVFDMEFRSDFFGMLRSWHNRRAMNSSWKNLDLVLVTSTEPYQLIEGNQSPFNVGEQIELTDFTLEQVTELNHRHGSRLTASDLQRLMELLGGHPYLVRRALYLIACGQISAPELFSRATEDRGPFGDHLRYHLFRMHGQEYLIEGLRSVIKRNRLNNERVFFRLLSEGLVRREGRDVVPRCRLYASYFKEHLYA